MGSQRFAAVAKKKSLSGSRQNTFRPTGRPPAQECRLRLKRPYSLHLNPRPRSALLHLRPFFRGSQSYRFAFSRKNMTQHIFSFESELQNNRAEVAPSSPNFSLSVSEKLARYGVDALSDVEHLGLLVGKEMLAARLLAHFGSLKTLAKVSIVELRSFMTSQQSSIGFGLTSPHRDFACYFV